MENLLYKSSGGKSPMRKHQKLEMKKGEEAKEKATFSYSEK